MNDTPAKAHVPIEETQVFKRFWAASNRVWTLVRSWDRFAQETLGGQLVRAIDSVGANLVEGGGRPSDGDAMRFFGIARSSAQEAVYWVGLAADRNLISVPIADQLVGELREATKMLNGLLNYRRQSRDSLITREPATAYDAPVDPTPVSPTP